VNYTWFAISCCCLIAGFVCGAVWCLGWLLNTAIRIFNPEPAVKINMERMKAALSTETIKAPGGMTREETIAFICKHAEDKQP